MATQNLTFRTYGLYSDEVFTSTDLNRRSGEVLNQARKNPVTIARNNERFALLRRDQAASMIRALAQMRNLIDVFQGAVSVKAGIEPPSSVAWMKALGEEDRMTMLQEVLTECQRASVDEDWESVGDLIHEWGESASVIESGVLRHAMEDPLDEHPLANPFLEPESEPCSAERP